MGENILTKTDDIITATGNYFATEGEEHSNGGLPEQKPEINFYS